MNSGESRISKRKKKQSKATKESTPKEVGGSQNEAAEAELREAKAESRNCVRR